MAVRNFYIDAIIDGRQTKLSGGPARKDGGLFMTLYQRNHGGIDTAVNIRCYENDGKLQTDVFVNFELVGSYVTTK